MSIANIIPNITNKDIDNLRTQLIVKYQYNLNLLASALRLIFHDCAGPNNDDPNIIAICNGCIDFNLTDNNGLKQVAVDQLNVIYHDNVYKWVDKMSLADFWAAAATVAVEYAHSVSNTGETLPSIPYYFGRTDCTDSSQPNTKSFPKAHHGWHSLSSFFDQIDFTTRDKVAIMGAHSVGSMHQIYSGYGNGAWDSTSASFDNRYYQNLLDLSAWTQTKNENHFYEWISGRQYYNKQHMLNIDMGLVLDMDKSGLLNKTNGKLNCGSSLCPHNNITWQIVSEYAQNNSLFSHDFVIAFNKLIQTGYDDHQLISITPSPSLAPSSMPSRSPTITPSSTPSRPPTSAPSPSPSQSPTLAPNATPSQSPTPAPTYHEIYYASVRTRSTKTTWTHFIYMIADNDLDDPAAMDLNEIIENESSQYINFLVFIDRGDWISRRALRQEEIKNIFDCNTGKPVSGYFTGAKLLQNEGDHWCELMDFYEMNSLSVKNIAQFVSLFRHFKDASTYFFLEFWDHGAACWGFGIDGQLGSDTKSIVISSNVELLVIATQTGLQWAGMKRVDVIGMDACYEADESILYYLHKYNITQYYLASERLEPPIGWDYSALFNYTDGPKQYAISYINSYMRQSDSNIDRPFTLTLFNMSEIAIFMDKLDVLIQRLIVQLKAKEYGVIVALLRAMQTSNVMVNEDMEIGDIGLLYSYLINDTRFFQKCEGLLSITKDAYNHFNQSIVDFDALYNGKIDNIQGASIFMSKSKEDIHEFNHSNHDPLMKHYATFLTILSDYSNGIDLNSTQSTKTCSGLTIPSDTTLSIQDVEFHARSSHKNESATILIKTSSIITSVEVSIHYKKTKIGDLSASINDISNEVAEITAYWNGVIVAFQDKSDLGRSVSYYYHPFGKYSCYCSENKVYLCVVHFSVNIYDDQDVRSRGYLQVHAWSDRNKSMTYRLFYASTDGERLKNDSNYETLKVSFLSETKETEIGSGPIFVGNIKLTAINISQNKAFEHASISVLAESVITKPDYVLTQWNVNYHKQFMAANNYIILITAIISSICVCLGLLVVIYMTRRKKTRKGFTPIPSNELSNEPDNMIEESRTDTIVVDGENIPLTLEKKMG